MWRIIFNDFRNITESARIGSTESSDGSSFVKAIGSPKSQLAKSVGKVSAKNLQMLSIIAEFYHPHGYWRMTQSIALKMAHKVEEIACLFG